jgi:hypothetical protein
VVSISKLQKRRAAATGVYALTLDGQRLRRATHLIVASGSQWQEET